MPSRTFSLLELAGSRKTEHPFGCAVELLICVIEAPGPHYDIKLHSAEQRMAILGKSESSTSSNKDKSLALVELSQLV